MVTSQTEEHVGEWKVAFEADAPEAIFDETAQVIAEAIGTSAPANGKWETISVRGRSLPTLLVDWANELVGRSEASGRAYAEVRNIRLHDRGGSAEITADVRARPVLDWIGPIKGATYHGTRLERRDGRWYGTILFDV